MTKSEVFTGETWRQIPGSNFEASTFGRVRTFRILSTGLNKWGYLRTRFRIKTKHVHKLVHQVVALAYLGECPSGKEVNHIDGNKKNNRPENLEYVTRLENAKNALARGAYRRGETHPFYKVTPVQKTAIIKSYSTGHLTMQQIAFMYDVSKATVSRVVAEGELL